MAAFNPSSFTETESMFRTEKTKAVSRFNERYFNGGRTYFIATSSTTVVEVRGLTRGEAMNYADSADYNYKDLHSVKFTGTGIGAGSSSASDCEGTECKAVARRINEADMWRVVITHVSTVVTFSENWTKSIY